MSGQDRAAIAARERRAPGEILRLALASTCALVIAIFLAPGARGEDAAPLDLTAALALARANSPVLDAARRRLAEARGELTGASVLVPENPEVEVGAGPRLLDPGVSGNRLAIEAGVSQRLEVAGQRGHRIGRARAEVASAEAEAEAAARALELAVATSFWQALAAAERAGVAGEHEALARELRDIAQARFDRGAATPVEVNAARIRLAEAARQRARSTADANAAAARLAPFLGLDPAHPPALAGTLPPPAESLPPMSPDATAHRPEVLSAMARTRGARATVDLAEAAAWPDVRLGVRYATEEGSRAVLGQLGIALPLFQRNQGERERARAAAARAEAEERAVRAQVATDVEEVRIEAERARAALAPYDADVLHALEENLTLLRAMLEAGKVAPAEVIVLQRELLEGRLGYLDARLEVAIAEARLRTAAGLAIQQGSKGGGP